MQLDDRSDGEDSKRGGNEAEKSTAIQQFAGLLNRASTKELEQERKNSIEGKPLAEAANQPMQKASKTQGAFYKPAPGSPAKVADIASSNALG